MKRTIWPPVATGLMLSAFMWCSPFATPQPKKAAPLPEEVMAAFKKIDAIYGGFVENALGRLQFQKGEKAAQKGLPAFQIRDFESGKLPDLPEVNMPIGMDFFLSLANDADLKKLKTLKKLTVLNLGTTNVTDKGLAELKGFDDLAALYLYRTKVTDKGLSELAALKNLTVLDLEGAKITDAGLKDLAKLKNLTWLNLDVTGVTDAGLDTLKQLPNLSTLKIGLTKVTDEGLKTIASFKGLTHLNLLGTNVSVGAVQELQKAMPKCEIVR